MRKIEEFIDRFLYSMPTRSMLLMSLFFFSFKFLLLNNPVRLSLSTRHNLHFVFSILTLMSSKIDACRCLCAFFCHHHSRYFITLRQQNLSVLHSWQLGSKKCSKKERSAINCNSFLWRAYLQQAQLKCLSIFVRVSLSPSLVQLQLAKSMNEFMCTTTTMMMMKIMLSVLILLLFYMRNFQLLLFVLCTHLLFSHFSCKTFYPAGPCNYEMI